MTTSICFVGTSMGCSVVSLFVTKYPQYADAICLLAPPRMSILQSFSFLLFCFFIQIACKEYESEIIEEVRKGNTEKLLPLSFDQYLKHFHEFVIKNKVPRLILKTVFESGKPFLDQHKKRMFKKFVIKYHQVLIF